MAKRTVWFSGLVRKATKVTGRFFAIVRLFVLLLAVVLLQKAFDAYGPIRALERYGYDALQWGLTLISDDVPERLVVIDMSDLQPQNDITPRDPLEKLLNALKAAHAKAVGIDVDFSPQDNQFIDAGDPQFFDRCRNLGIPVFLGVVRMARAGRDAWLGRPQYADLAASILIPRDAATITEKSMPGPYPLYFSKPDAPPSSTASRTDDLASMAFKLASRSSHRNANLLADASRWSSISDLVAERSIDDAHRVVEFALDYHFVDYIARTAIRPKWDDGPLLDATGAQAVQGSFVLVGDVHSSSVDDTFDAPGRSDRISGVLVHATAAMTLLRPLRVFKPWMKNVLDAVCLAAALTFLHEWSKRRTRHRRSGPPRRRLILSREQMGKILIVASIAIAVASFVLFLGILWFDWLAFMVVGAVDAVFEKATEVVAEAEPV